MKSYRTVLAQNCVLRTGVFRAHGELIDYRDEVEEALAPAILSLSGNYPTRTCYRFMGWTQINGTWTYVAPGECVNANGVVSAPPEIELDTRLRDYRLQDTGWQYGLSAFQAMIAVFPEQLAPVIYTILEWLVRRKTPGRKRPWTGRAILEVFEEFSVVAQVFKDGSRLWLPPPFSDDQQILWGVLNLPNIADFLTSLEAGT